jgi:putative salt-induced outer membrane protein YdiY
MMLLMMAFFFPPVTVSADEVYLKNGNHLSGTLISMGEGKLVLETAFAGRLNLDWEHVLRVETESPLTIMLEDGSKIKGIPKPSDFPGQMTLVEDTTLIPVPVSLAAVEAINPPEERPVKLNGRINVGFNKASGNTNLENAHVDAELIARTWENRVTLGGTYNRAAENDQKTEDNATGHLKHDYFLTSKLYWYLHGLIERNEFKDINLRTTVGPGLGYQAFEGELMNIALEAGSSYVNTNYDQGPDEDSIAGRWAVKFDRFFFEKLFQFYFANEGYVSASDASDVFMFTKTGMRFPVRGGLFLNAGFEWDWDNTPAEGADDSDYRYILSLGYGF